jgi:Dolichyl-phosphate-mannose-protein mannosyltransferase
VLNRLGLSLYPAFLAALWFSYIAAEAGIFHGFIPLAVFVTVTLCFLLKGPAENNPPDNLIWLVLLLAAVAGWWSCPPGHVMQSQWDPAMYVQSGSVIAREGGITFDLSSFHQLPSVIQHLVSFPAGQPVPYAGFILREDGQAVPLFFHLFNSWIAMLFSFGGIDLALAANIPLYMLSVCLMYFLVRRWMNEPWALVCALLLALSAAQLWQSRFPTSELLAQVLLLGGFIFLDRALQSASTSTRRSLDAVISGLSFGLAFMARVDSILVVGPLMVLLCGLLFSSHGRSAVWVLAAMAIPFAHACFHVRALGSPYLPRPEILYPSLLTLILAALGRGVFAFKGRGKHPAAIMQSFRLSIVLSVTWLVWILWAWQIRPRLMLDGNVARLVESMLGDWSDARMYAIISGRDAWNMMLLQKLCGWPLLLSSTVGVVHLLVRHRDKTGLRLWLLISMFVTACLITSLHHERAMMWMTRRFIPVILPFMIITAAAAGWWLWPSQRVGNTGRKIGALGIVTLLLLGMYPPLQKVWTMREFYGTKDGFNELAEKLNRDALVFSDVTGVGATLRTVYGLEAYELNNPSMARRYQLIDQLFLLNTNRPVMLVTPVPSEDIHQTRMIERGSATFSADVYDQSRTEIPIMMTHLESPFYIYELLTGASTGHEP